MTKFLNSCATLWHLFRVNNLLIILLTLYLLQYFLVLPILNNNAYNNCFSTLEWICFVLSIVFIAAGGNCVNDCMDRISDAVNKKKHKAIGQNFSYHTGIIIYYIVTSIGLLLAIVPSYGENIPWLFLCFMLTTISLWQYSTFWKKTIFLGNLLIATLSALVVILPFLIPINMYKGTNATMIQDLCLLMSIYGGFAFLLSLIRELIKTMEDVRGDAHAHCRTIAVVYGIKKTKKIVLWLTAIVTIILIITTILLVLYQKFIFATYVGIAIVLPCCLLLYEIFKIKNSKNCHNSSLITKGIMLTGILSTVLTYLFLLK